jgi:hypothetical protein
MEKFSKWRVSFKEEFGMIRKLYEIMLGFRYGYPSISYFSSKLAFKEREEDTIYNQSVFSLSGKKFC